jgi:hypothetical protein
MTTHDLWKNILLGDDKAMAELILRLENVILAESKLNGQVHEDVAQEIREKLIRAIRKELGRES